MKRRLADRRGRPRFEIVGELWGVLETTLTLPLLNVGEHGALVQSPIALPLESVHQVTFRCDGHVVPSGIRVRHARPGKDLDGQDCFFVGVEFLATSPVLGAQIDRWFDRTDIEES